MALIQSGLGLFMQPVKVYEDPLVTIYQGDILDCLKVFDSQVVQTVMTSPPYLWVRDYVVDGSWGQEQTWRDWINHMVEFTEAIKYILKPDGSLWLNLDDRIGNARTQDHQNAGRVNRNMSFMMMPERVAIELGDNHGWIRKGKIIWYKPSAMADFVGRGRFTRMYEMLYWFTLSEQYKFNLDDIRIPGRTPEIEEVVIQEPSTDMQLSLIDLKPDDPSSIANAPPWGTPEYEHWYHNVREKSGWHDHDHDEIYGRRNDLAGALRHPKGVVPGDVWSITKDLAGRKFKRLYENYSVFPEELCYRPILATSDIGDIILDPFAGSGTVGVVAKRFGRKAVLFDIDPKACEMAAFRVREVPIPMESFLRVEA